MAGGAICSNTVTGGDGWGGGVTVRGYNDDARFVMTGGEIAGNRITGTAADAGGGGVAVVMADQAYSAAFIMAGGEISANNTGPAGRESLFLLKEGTQGDVFAQYGPIPNGGQDILTGSGVGLSGSISGRNQP
jgi:hypothetical protein